MVRYLLLFFIASSLSVLLTPLSRSLSLKLGALDFPDERKVHRRPIPQLGGLSLFLTFHLVFFLASRLEFFAFPPQFLQTINYAYLLAASAIVFAMGAADDFWRISPTLKILFQSIGGLIISFTPFRVQEISFPFGSLELGVWAIPFTILWVVAITNALNLLDGLDGLAAGTTFIVSLSIFAIGLLNENTGSPIFCIILAGTALGFLRYNFHPASIFLGNSGAYFLGFMLSLLSLQSHAKNTTAVVMLIPLLLLGLPLMDTVLSVLRRLLKPMRIVKVNGTHQDRKIIALDKWSLFQADREHIHHRLLQLGFTHSRAVIFLYSISLVLGMIAFSSVYFSNLNQALLLFAIGISSFIGIKKLQYSDMQVLRNGTLLPLFSAPWISQRIVKTFFDMGAIAFAYYLSLFLRYEGKIEGTARQYFLETFPIVIAVQMTVFFLAGLYRGAWQFGSVIDFVKVGKAAFLACFGSALCLWVIPGPGGWNWTIWVIDFHLIFFLILALRSSFPILEYFYETNHAPKKKILIYGVGQSGFHALKEFIQNPRLNLSPVGFIDEDGRIPSASVTDYPLLGSVDSLERIFQQNDIQEVIVAQNDIPPERLSLLADICRSHGVTLRRFQTRQQQTPQIQ